MGFPWRARGGGSAVTRGLRALAVALCAAALLAGQYAPAAADEDPLADALRKKQDLERAIQVSRQNTERYKQAANQFQAAVDSANARIGLLATKQAAAQTQAEALGYEIQIAEEQLQLVTFQLKETKALVDSLQAKAAEQARQLAQREDLYTSHLRATYQQAQVSPLEMLLTAGSLSEFATRVQALVLVNRQDVQLASDIRAIKQDTTQKAELAAAKAEEINGLQDQIGAQRARLAERKAQYDELVRQAQAAIAAQARERQNAAESSASALDSAQRQTRETTNLNGQLERAEAAYTELATRLAARSGLGRYGGRLSSWPLSGGVITSTFGPRVGGFHNGVDIAAPIYSPILAAAAGRVVTVGKPYLASGDSATVVIVAHGDNFSTLYGHLDDRVKPPVVVVGQYVQAGQVIAYEGNTGFSTGPHLHFMTIVNGAAQSPFLYLP